MTDSEPALGSGRRQWTVEELAAGICGGDRRALSRAITLVENADPRSYEIISRIYPETGKAYAIGVTGSPGAGKSSLISALVGHLRARDRQVGVISVDPSSPFTRGALLGDRIRLTEHFLDPGVYIRSMGTRGHLGGLAEQTRQVLLMLDAAGSNEVFVETVGTGQTEVEVAGTADTVVLVMTPGTGDEVQALKAGIMEIPDVIVVNKMDHPAAKATVAALGRALSITSKTEARAPIVLTDALRREGIPELWDRINGHRTLLEQNGDLEQRRRKHLMNEVFAIASLQAAERVRSSVSNDPELARLMDLVQSRALDPLTAVHEILEKVFRRSYL